MADALERDPLDALDAAAREEIVAALKRTPSRGTAPGDRKRVTCDMRLDGFGALRIERIVAIARG
jgi:hypothetical protein